MEVVAVGVEHRLAVEDDDLEGRFWAEEEGVGGVAVPLLLSFRCQLLSQQ